VLGFRGELCHPGRARQLSAAAQVRSGSRDPAGREMQSPTIEKCAGFDVAVGIVGQERDRRIEPFQCLIDASGPEQEEPALLGKHATICGGDNGGGGVEVSEPGRQQPL
jgi:hypothetical protein